MNEEKKLLSDLTVFSKYARWWPELGRREVLDEIVARNLKMHKENLADNNELQRLLDEAHRMVQEKKIFPSMRSFQFAGRAIDANHARIYNCSFMFAKEPTFFRELFYLLLGGTGVGYGVTREAVNQLPPVNRGEGTETHVIADDIEGWSNAVDALVHHHLFGAPKPEFDYSLIRPKGALLRTSGGRAPGPEPLRASLDDVHAVLSEAPNDTRLRPIQVHSVACLIARAVLSGGIRRSAMISLFSPDDEEMLTAKSGAWWEKNSHFAYANNSAVLLRGRDDYLFDSVFERCRASGAGEPGILWVDDLRYGTNPCKPLRSTILTPEGYITFEEALKREELTVVLPNGGTARASKPFLTGTDRVVMRALLSNGQSLYGTGNHLHMTADGEWRRMDEIQVGDRLMSQLNVPALQVVAIDPEYSVEDVYDITVYDDSHAFIDTGVVTHNCGEITLNHKQFCVSGDTKIITRDGIVEIADAVGKEVEIWNGEQWSKVTPYITGTDDVLYRVYFSDGSFLDATANHKFIIEDMNLARGMEEVETLEIAERLRTAKKTIRLPRANVVYEDGEHEEYAYEYGVFLGDGHVNTNGKIQIGLFKDIQIRGRKVGRYSNINGVEFDTYYLDDLDEAFSVRLKHSYGLPKEVFGWDKSSILRFIAGWADTDGTNASKGIRIYGSEDKIRDAQMLLTKIGINSSVNLMARSGEKTNMGTRKKDVWYLQITKTSEIPCQRLTCKNDSDANYKGKYQNVRSIVQLPGTHYSYCLTEESLHQCVFNNVLTKQCNLTTINASTITNQDDFNKRAYYAAVLGTFQAAYTDFKYLTPEWRRQTEEEALLGVSITGIADRKLDNLDLEMAAQFAVAANAYVAQLLGINPAARVTTLKPEGSASLVAGTASGIHAWHDKIYVRRTRYNKIEPIAKYLISKFGIAERNPNYPQVLEQDAMNPDQVILSIPLRAPENAITRDEGAVSTLERVKRFQRGWIRPGNTYGGMTNNVSATINVRDHEWDEVKEWMYNNRYEYNGLSLLPYSDHTYVQAPYETCDEDTHARLTAEIAAANIDIREVDETEDYTNHADIVACAGGACELPWVTS